MEISMKEQIEKEVELAQVEEIIKTNVAKFEYEGKNYRIRPLTFQEKQESYKKKLQKYDELLASPDNLLEDQLKKKYKLRDIDIDEMSRQITTLEMKKYDLEIKLAKMLKDKDKEESILQLKEEIVDIKSIQMDISMRKINLLQSSIESQVLTYVYEYITFRVTEIFHDEKWVAAWNKYEDFLSAPDGLVNRASFNATLIIGNI